MCATCLNPEGAPIRDLSIFPVVPFFFLELEDELDLDLATAQQEGGQDKDEGWQLDLECILTVLGLVHDLFVNVAGLTFIGEREANHAFLGRDSKQAIVSLPHSLKRDEEASMLTHIALEGVEKGSILVVLERIVKFVLPNHSTGSLTRT